VKAVFIQQPFDEFLRFNYEKVSETSIKIILPIQPLFLNSAGVVHGGIISSLADVAMCNTFEVDENNRQTVVTVDLKITFIKGAKGEVLIAHAHQVKKGRTLSHADCFIYDENNNLVAKANGIFANC
jgi:uncharacterized protein (TIGR00369 family)